MKTQKSVDELEGKKLHLEFVRLGSLRHKLKNRMLAILPEIYKSGIWKKYSSSIFEYAGKHGDIAKTTVIKRLRLEEKLSDLPYLKAAIEKVGVHKVAMVAKIANAETDSNFADYVLNMSKMAVQSLSKEIRANANCSDFLDDGLVDQTKTPLCKAVPIIKKIELDEESTFQFMKLKAKLGKNLSDREFIKLILEEREKREFPEVKNGNLKTVHVVEKQSISAKSEGVSDQKSITGDTFYKVIKAEKSEIYSDCKSSSAKSIAESRYIPAGKKREIITQTNGKCAYPNCNSPYQVIHHTNRYSESKNHNSVLPLCKIHHEFAHNNLIQNETLATDKWEMAIAKQTNNQISKADILYKKYRQEALV